jgi:hypothetical protein
LVFQSIPTIFSSTPAVDGAREIVLVLIAPGNIERAPFNFCNRFWGKRLDIARSAKNSFSLSDAGVTPFDG